MKRRAVVRRGSLLARSFIHLKENPQLLEIKRNQGFAKKGGRGVDSSELITPFNSSQASVGYSKVPQVRRRGHVLQGSINSGGTNTHD